MKKIIPFFLFCLFCVNAYPSYSQVSRAALITDSDFTPGMQLMGGVGFGMGIVPGASIDEVGYGGFELSFSLGSFENRFNLELATGIRGGNNVDRLIPLIIAPRYNISRVSSGSGYIYLQPEVGYTLNLDADGGHGVYGGRLGLGLSPFGSLYIGFLGSFESVRVNTDYESRFVYFSVGYTYHFWKRS